MLRDKPRTGVAKTTSAVYAIGAELANHEKQAKHLVEHKQLGPALQEQSSKWLAIVEKDKNLQRVLEIEKAMIGEPWPVVADVLTSAGLEPNSGTVELRIGCWAMHSSLAQSYMVQQMGDKALPHFREALALVPAKNYREAKKREAIFAVISGTPLELEVYGYNRVDSKKEATKWKDKANSCVKNGEWAEALEFYDKALKKEPDWATIYSNKAIVYWKQFTELKKKETPDSPVEEKKKAWDLLQKVVDNAVDCRILDAASKKGVHYMTLGYTGLGKWRAAMDTVWAALEVTPRDADLQNDLAVVQQAMLIRGVKGETSVDDWKPPTPVYGLGENSLPDFFKDDDGVELTWRGPVSGRAIRATKDYQEGEVVFQDKALAITVESPTHVPANFATLCPPPVLDYGCDMGEAVGSKLATSLHSDRSPLALQLYRRLSLNPEETDAILSQLCRIDGADAETFWAEQEMWKVEADWALLSKEETGLSVVAPCSNNDIKKKWYSWNGFCQLQSIIHLAHLQLKPPDSPYHGSALYPKFSVGLNHSCMNNIELTLTQDHQLAAKACVRIRKGEYLTTSYTPLEKMDGPKPRRQDKIYSQFQFKCTCGLCENE